MKKVISFSGLDGSGKSSLIKRLNADLPDSEIVHIIHFRVINRLKRSKSSTTESIARSRPSAITSFINTGLMIFDALIFNLYALLARRTIICDRYFYDLIATNHYRYGPSWLSAIVLLVIRKPDKAFFIEVEPEQALLREQDGSHDITYFETLQNVYQQQFISRQVFEVVENKDLDKAYQQIKRSIESLS